MKTVVNKEMLKNWRSKHQSV